MGPQGDMGRVLGREQRRRVGYLPAGTRKKKSRLKSWLRRSIPFLHHQGLGRGKKDARFLDVKLAKEEKIINTEKQNQMGKKSAQTPQALPASHPPAPHLL